MAEIKVCDFSFTYPLSGKKAVDSISFCVRSGDFVLVCGKSGCGKTTLLKSLKSEIAPEGEKEGYILVDGREQLPALESAHKIGFVMQDPENQIVTDTVWHELAFGLENMGLPTDVIRRRVGEVAHFFGIQSWFEKSVFELSGGQKQILSLAAVVAMQADVVILDEPTAQLDPIAAKEFLQMLHRIHTELGKTVILSEHRLEDVLEGSDSVLYLENGRAGFYGSNTDFIEYLRENEKNEFVLALPAPTRLALRYEARGPYPMSVRQGRAWFVRQSETRCFYAEMWEEGPRSEEVAVRAKDLWYRYGRQDDFALKGLTVEIRQRELHCVVGGNGSGKSTLLGAIGGILRPSRGKIKTATGEKVGMLPQNPKTLFVCDTVAADLREHDSSISEEDVMKMTRLLGIEDVLDRHPYDLSGGEMQKTALAKVLLLKPDILLLDEPVKGLDAFAKKEMAEILEALKAQGKTVILVTHDIEFAAMYADACSMVFNGSVIANGRGKEFFAGNSFYTTSINRMTRGLLSGCVTVEDVKCKGC